MLAAGYAERERIKQEQGNVLLFWFLLSALITSSSVLFFPAVYQASFSSSESDSHMGITVVALENSFSLRSFD